ncbi:MAG: hypothetical protein CMP54_03985 [Flavobacteriales bacterium]|nr:hypothetical protein [Flavobacteriales bacterium]
MSKFAFQYCRTLSGSHDNGTKLSTNDRFINLSCNKNQIQTTMPRVNELFPPLCIPSGSRFMVWNTSWGLFESPNTIARDLIEKRFIEKYDKKLMIHKYELDGSYYLFVILTNIIPMLTSMLMDNKTINEDLQTIDNLYIGAFITKSNELTQITNSGNINHYINLPLDILEFDTGVETTYTNEELKYLNETFDDHQFYDNIRSDGRSFTLTFTEKQSDLLMNILNDIEIPLEDMKELFKLFITFEDMKKQGGNLQIRAGQTTYDIDMIIDKMNTKLH